VSSEKPESDEFEDEDTEESAPGGDDVDVDQVMRDVETQRRRAPKGGAEPAWRRLERVMEERRTAELLSDFDDYDIHGDDEAESDSEAGPGTAHARKKKKTR
jgi:hypothetical protein